MPNPFANYTAAQLAPIVHAVERLTVEETSLLERAAFAWADRHPELFDVYADFAKAQQGHATDPHNEAAKAALKAGAVALGDALLLLGNLPPELRDNVFAGYTAAQLARALGKVPLMYLTPRQVGVLGMLVQVTAVWACRYPAELDFYQQEFSRALSLHELNPNSPASWQTKKAIENVSADLAEALNALGPITLGS